jgi:T1SS-143 domain-containing protein
VLTFDVGFAEDYDLDKVIGQINIKVNDDQPEVGITYCNEDPGGYTSFAFGGAIHDTDFGRIDEDWLKGAVTNDGYTYYVPIGNQDRDYFYNDNANKFGDDYGSDHLSGQINMDYGADGEGARTLTLAGFSGDFKDADNNQLFSDGHKLEVLTSEIGLLEIGYKVGNVETIVFTLELDQNGHFDFTQKMPIDHPIESPIEDNVYLAIKAGSITDGDGDTVDAVIKIQVNDDVPETGITYDSGDPKARSEAIVTYGAPFVDYGQIDEDFLPLSGNQDHDNSTWGSPSDPDRGDEAGGLFVTGTLGGTNYGADGPDGTPSHAFVLSGLGKNDPFLDADGKQVESHGNPLVVINSTGSLLEVGYGTTVVFTLTMTSDTEFEFELKGPLDQVNTPGGKLEDGTVLVFGAEDTGAATDKDGDPAARIVIHVNDDAPMVCEVSYTSFFEITGEDGVATVANATGSGIHGSVDEDQLSTGQGNLDTDNDPSGTHSDVVRGDTIGSNVATGYVAINFGADGPADNAFALDEYKAGDIFYDADGNAYTSHGHILTVLDADADHVYVGYSDNAVDTTVFEIRLDRNAGSFSFNLQAPLDHPNAGTEDDLPVTFNVTATDFDGDSVTTKLSIHVNDDAPAGGTVDYSEAVIFPGTAFGAVDEDYAAGGNEDDDGDAGATDGQGGGSVIATVTVTPFAPGIGADGPADHPYSLAAYAPGTNFTDINGNTVTAKFDDTPLVVISSSDSELVVGHSGGAAVFKVTLDQDSGAATFSLLEGLDNLSGDNDESGDIPLSFAVLARDYDGDTATTTVRIMVNDDRPVGVADTATIDSAGGASGNVLGNDKGGADGLKVVMPVPGETSHIFTGVFGGSLTLHEDGSWSYLADAGRDNETEVQESFNYSIIDGDNDTSAATLTITIPPAEISTRSAPANSVYDDSAYALHIAETGKDVDATDHASYHPGDNVKIEDNSPGGLLQLKGGHDLRGGSGDDLIFGNDGPDDIYGRAGHDAMSGGKGADAFRDVDAADLDGSHTLDGIHSIDGGEGIDTVYLGGLKTFDSSQAGKIENVEVLNFKGDPAGAAGTQVTLNYDAAYGVTQVGGLHSLTIMGDAGKDTVNLVGSSGKSWVHDFDLFGAQVFHAGSGPDDRVTVTVEAGVQVTLS